MKSARLTFLTLVFLSCFQSTASAANDCGATKLAEVRAAATQSKKQVWVDCNLNLIPSDIITKKIRIRGADASGITIDCNGARLDGAGTPSASEERIRIDSEPHMADADTCKLDSTGYYCSYDRPENVTVRECAIYGRVRVGRSMAGYPEVTRHSDFTQVARKYAPRDIRFEDVTIHVDNEMPIFVYPGVGQFQLIDSRLYGTSDSLALYLDAESYGHEIRNNHFGVDTTREIIAIDGSSENLIVNNYFVYTKNGGIYLYRNCGEAPGNSSSEPGAGSIRHATPSFNHIINNEFNNGSYSGDNPNIWLGRYNGDRGFCDADLRSNGTPYPWGSSISDLDYARNNVVMQNQFYNRSPEDMLRIGRPASDKDNVIAYNQQVSSGIDRKAGCYLPNSVTSPLLEHQVTKAAIVDDRLSVSCERRICDDGVLSTTGTCPFAEVDFGCQVTGSNSGCHVVGEACPAVDGHPGRVASAKAACNLESGSVSAQQVYEVRLGEVMVVRASDDVSEGVCYVEQTDISNHSADIWTSSGDTNLSFGCMEYDANGGDCHIKGKLYCE